MNLLICSSPFQVLVAKKIIEHYPEKSFYGMMLLVSDNAKYRHYANELINSCQDGQCYVLKKSKHLGLILLDLLALKIKGLVLKNIEDIYLASFDSILVQTLISGIDFRNLYTFDDGTANLVKDSYYYHQDRHTALTAQLLKKLLNNPYDLLTLKEKSKKHFTVFHAKNVMKNAHYLPLLPTNHQPNNHDKKANKNQKIMMVGQPIYEMNPALTKAQIKQKNRKLSQKVVQTFAVEYYLPHPRENYHLDGVDYIHSELVAEDYFYQNIASDTDYVIYTFCSGAVLPFVGMDNVKIIGVLPADCPKNLLAAYELLEAFDIAIITVDGS